MATLRHYVMATGWRETGFFVRGTGHFIIKEPESPKYADFAEIFWIVRGEGFFKDKRGFHLLKPGWVWYYPPDSVHDFCGKSGELDYRWLSIEGEDCGRLFDSLRICPGKSYAGECPEHCFADIELALPEGSAQSQMCALASAVKILTQVAAPAPENRPFLEKVKEIMHDNYSNAHLDIDYIANLVHVHRVTLSRSFKEFYGIEPSRYLTSIRLQQGIRLLTETKLPVKEIALRCGFSSGSYFGKVLLIHTGHTPKNFRH